MNRERIKEIETDFALGRFVSPNDLLRICDLARDGLTAREGGVTLREAIDAANSALTHAADDPDGPVIDAAAISVVTALRVLAAQKAGERGPGSDRASEQANATATPAALDATPSLAARAEGGAVGVKALEWRPVDYDRDGNWHTAETATGLTYSAFLNRAGLWRCTIRGAVSLPNIGDFVSLDAAKVAAQADYDTRIHSALVLTPAGAEAGEAVVREAFKQFCIHDWNKPSWWGQAETDRFVTRLAARLPAPASPSAVRAEALPVSAKTEKVE